MSAVEKKLMITGVSGLLGSNLAFCLKDSYDILGVYHSKAVSIDSIQTTGVDFRDSLETRKVVEAFHPEILIHCAAQANVDFCEANQRLAWQSNVLSTQNILQSIPDSTRFIYISTDLVYDGHGGLCDENAPLGPKNHYARTKLEAEKLTLGRKNALVLRTNFFGWSIFDRRSLAEWGIDQLKAKRHIIGFKDAVFSSIYTFDLAAIIDAIIQKDLSGVYNCACSTSHSKYDFLVKIANRLGLDASLIKPGQIDESQLKAERSKNLSLDVSRLQRDLGRKLPTIDESIEHFAKDFPKNYSEVIKRAKYYPWLKSIPYGRQCLDEQDIIEVVNTLKSSNLTQGSKIEEFEAKLCSKVHAQYATAVNSGTSALHIACMAVDIRPGDEVITSPNTFVATANAVLYCGARPVFADIDPVTYNLSPEKLEKKINARTKAVIPVHFAGQSCDMQRIVEVVRAAEKKYGNKIYIIEDASHALGSQYRTTYVGSCAYCDIAVTSFHPVKHITTAEGGALFTNDSALYRKFCALRSHGLTSREDEFVQAEEAVFEGSGKSQRNPWYYEQQWLGFNYRITDIQCALGISQLDKLERFTTRRREIVRFYNKAFANTPFITIPFESAENNTNFHLYVLRIDFGKAAICRAELMTRLREQNIITQVHYIPVHTQPYYQQTLKTGWGDCPEAENYYRQCLSIPLYPGLSDDELASIVVAIKGLLTR